MARQRSCALMPPLIFFRATLLLRLIRLRYAMVSHAPMRVAYADTRLAIRCCHAATDDAADAATPLRLLMLHVTPLPMRSPDEYAAFSPAALLLSSARRQRHTHASFSLDALRRAPPMIRHAPCLLMLLP